MRDTDQGGMSKCNASENPKGGGETQISPTLSAPIKWYLHGDLQLLAKAQHLAWRAANMRGGRVPPRRQDQRSSESAQFLDVLVDRIVLCLFAGGGRVVNEGGRR